jgi:hypothetical protein
MRHHASQPRGLRSPGRAVITRADSSSAVFVVTVRRTHKSCIIKVTWRDDVERDDDSQFSTVDRSDVVAAAEAFLERTVTSLR